MAVDDDGETELGAVSVPERLRQCLLKRLKGIQRIEVQWEEAEKKWKRVESFKVANQPGEWPDGEEEIVERCARIIFQHWSERGAGDPINYRIWCTGYEKSGKRRRPSFQHLYAGPDNADPEQEDDEDDEEGDYTIAMVLQQQAAIIDKVTLRLDEAHVHIRELSRQNNETLQPLKELVGYAGQMYVAAMEMQKRALFVIHDTRRSEREAEAADRRLEKYADIFGPALKRLAPMFAAWVKSKVAGNEAGPAPTVEDVEDDEDDGGPQSADTETDDGSEEQPDPHFEGEPVADIARSLSQMLGPSEWGTVAARLTKAEFQRFADLLDARTDAQVVARWDAILKGSIPLSKLAALQEELSEDQQQGFEVLQGAISEYKRSQQEQAES